MRIFTVTLNVLLKYYTHFWPHQGKKGIFGCLDAWTVFCHMQGQFILKALISRRAARAHPDPATSAQEVFSLLSGALLSTQHHNWALCSGGTLLNCACSSLALQTALTLCDRPSLSCTFVQLLHSAAVIWAGDGMPCGNNHGDDGAATKLMLYKALLNVVKHNKKQAKNNHLWYIYVRKGSQQLFSDRQIKSIIDDY